MSTTAQSRPKTLTAEMAIRVGQELAGDMVKQGIIEDSERDELAAIIARFGHRHIDGFKLASDLDQYGHLEGSAEVVEILDSFSHLADDEIRAAQKQWAADNGITAPLPVGSRVRLLRNWRGEPDEFGVITGLCDYRPAAFHIAIDGDPNAAPPHHARRIVNFEDVELADVADARGHAHRERLDKGRMER